MAADTAPPGRWIVRGVLAAVYVIAGAAHLLSPGGFLAITPPWVPAPATVIAATGVCELAGAVALLTRRFRWWAGAMLALYAVCVFPANIHHALAHVAIGGTTLGWGYHAPRLLLQPVLVWWALYAGAVIDWPFIHAKGPPGSLRTARIAGAEPVGQAEITVVPVAEPVRDTKQ